LHILYTYFDTWGEVTGNSDADHILE